MSKSKKGKSESPISKILKDTGIRESRNENDTLKIWENYREQATLWRGLALLQVLITGLSLVLCFYLYATRDIKLNVPQKPLPGFYSANQVPESEFISVAEDFVNLIASYQYKNANRQFNEAANSLIQPLLDNFNREMLGTELNLIKQTQRTQLFFIDHEKTTVDFESNRKVKVRLIGERTKTIAGVQYDGDVLQYTVTLTTIPRNRLNDYGIVVQNLELIKLKS